jgi:hypothetical protein
VNFKKSKKDLEKKAKGGFVLFCGLRKKNIKFFLFGLLFLSTEGKEKKGEEGRGGVFGSAQSWSRNS